MRSLIILSFILISSIAFSNVRAYFYYAPFYNESSGTFVETYLTVIGKTVKFNKISENNYQSSLEIIMLFKQDGQIKEFKKYNLMSPVINDTISYPNFIDQQRISLKNGTYVFELQITDKNNSNNVYTYNDVITVNYTNNDFEFSGIQLVESYKATSETNILSKNGYDLVPYVSDFYPDNLNQLTFYCEIYNTNSLVGNDTEYLLTYYLENDVNKAILNEYSRIKKQKSNKLSVVFGELNIEKLPSAAYNLVIEIKNRENQILKVKKFKFLRSNPKFDNIMPGVSNISFDNTFVTKFNNIDTLKEYMKCIRPICDYNEALYSENHANGDNLKAMQNFFYSFWLKRSYTDPEGAWITYFEQVKMVNKLYGSQIKKGYETDRGRVYLQYGSPNSVVDQKHEPNSYPYEIWHYYKIMNESNKKFIFYNPDLVGNDYQLLHSDVKGEIYTKNWEMVLNKRSTPIYNHDQLQGTEHFGNKSNDLFKNP